MKLVYLVFSPNECYCNVLTEKPESLTVDEGEKTWRYKYAEHHQLERIGKARYHRNSRHGVIGVYDLDDLTQVNSMVFAAIESQRDHSGAD